MTEPSKEAIRAAKPYDLNEYRVQSVLRSALPIERERWEKKAHERLVDAFISRGIFLNREGYAALDAIFDKGDDDG